MEELTKNDFFAEALTWPLGYMVFVAGSESDRVGAVLEETVDYIENNSTNSAILFDSNSTILYPERRYHFLQTEDNPGPGIIQARLWEYVKNVSLGDFVSLISHKLTYSFPSVTQLKSKIILDFQMPPNPTLVPQGVSRSLSSPGGVSAVGFREMVPFVNEIYYYQEVPERFIFVKTRDIRKP